MIFKQPMLAASLLPPDVEHTDDVVFSAMKKLKMPVAATLKKDGIRGLRLNGTDVSRTLKKIPNDKVCERSKIMPGGFDYEHWSKSLQYDEIESIVMSRVHDDSELIEFHVLDWFHESYGYNVRTANIMRVIRDMPSYVRFSPPVLCENAEQLFAFEKVCIEEAGEGICFRTLNSPYKQGRSTLREQYLVKLSRFIREEAVIVDFIEQMENANSEKRNAVGKMDRSSSQSRLFGKDTLGAFVVRGSDGLEFNVGTGVGLTDKLRQKIWDNRSKYVGKSITYKTKPHGRKIKPRSPVWVGFREEGY